MHVAVLRIPVPLNIRIIWFEDDIAIVVTSKVLQEITEDAKMQHEKLAHESMRLPD